MEVIFTSIASLLRFLELFVALFQGISYWLETLQAGQAEELSCLASLEWKVFPGNLNFSGKPGRRSFLPGLPGEFLANKECLEKVPQKIVKIIQVRHFHWKWPPQGCSALKSASDGVIFAFWPKRLFLTVSEGPCAGANYLTAFSSSAFVDVM